MDLGIEGRRAIVCAASKGLGKGSAMALAADGVDLVINARGRDLLEATAEQIRSAHGVKVTAIAADITTEEGRRAVLAACPDPDILVNNAGGPPPGDFRNFALDDWRRAVEGNMLTPLALIHETVYGMMDRGFGRIVNITSSSVKSPIHTLELSNGARAGLTGAVAALARRAVRRNVTINGLLPGWHDTDRIRSSMGGRAKAAGIPYDAYIAKALEETPAGRMGTIEEFGAACAFLCSAKAGYITGQNILIDGGDFPGLV
ncbi:MAG: SDR family oxidoreductase [Hyphomicrobiaceae bacterium]